MKRNIEDYDQHITALSFAHLIVQAEQKDLERLKKLAEKVIEGWRIFAKSA